MKGDARAHLKAKRRWKDTIKVDPIDVGRHNVRAVNVAQVTVRPLNNRQPLKKVKLSPYAMQTSRWRGSVAPIHA